MGVYNKTKLTQIGRHVYGRTDNDKDNGCAECLKKLLGTLKALNEKPSTKANKSMQALGIICSNASPLQFCDLRAHHDGSFRSTADALGGLEDHACERACGIEKDGRGSKR